MAERLSLYDYQKDAVQSLLGGKNIVYAQMGAGKLAISLAWLRALRPTHVLYVSTASKVKSGDIQAEADIWFPEWVECEEFTIISWHVLARWYREQRTQARKYVVVFDEVAKAKAGVSSQMGKAFLNITELCKAWSGYTGTPGDVWMSFYPYFQATGRVRNKTHFQREFCNIQTYKGYPEIVGYHHEDTLNKWWGEISCSPDTKKMYDELPNETHRMVEFKAGADYKKFMKNKDRKRIDNGEFLETNMAVQHYIRQLCSTKEKLEWLKDFAETTDSGAVIFYSYIEEGKQIEETIKKACPNSKIWRINGKHHEIPTAETIGDKDFVITHWASGSEALNLQFLHQWVSYSPNYSYSASVQARGRIKRIGQKHPMFYYYLKCSGTVEDNVYKALKSKSDFASDVWCKENGLWIDE